MKTLLLRPSIVVLVAMFCNTAHAQDLIVLTKGDSIHCKIIDNHAQTISYVFFNGSQVVKEQQPQSVIATVRYAYFNETIVSPVDLVMYVNPIKFRLAVDGGWSRNMAPVGEGYSQEYIDFMEKLRSGLCFSADAHYFLVEYVGLGVKYSLARNTNQLDDVLFVFDGATQRGTLRHDVSVNYFAVSAIAGLPITNEVSLFMGSSMGVLAYKNKAVYVTNYTLTSATYGITLDIGLDYKLSSNVALGIKLSATLGALMSMTVDDGSTKETWEYEEDEYESLSRVELSCGLRFIK